MSKRSRRWGSNRQKVDPLAKFTVDQAVELVREGATAKFDETVDVAVRRGGHPNPRDKRVGGATTLPPGPGKTVRVVVFAQGEPARLATEAGADVVGGDELINKIQNENWLDFDKAIATRDMMGKVGRLGRVLGPRGLMPNPKVGTVVGPEHVAQTVVALKGGRIVFRVEKAGIVHAPVGKASMSATALKENLLALINELFRLKPSTAKGTYLRGAALSSTMGVGVRLDVNDVARETGKAG